MLATSGGEALVLPVNLLFALVGVPEGGWVGRAGYAADRAGAMPLMKPSRLGRPEGRNREMDERQWQQRSQAHLRALGVVWAASTC
ncbi:hypothetical protein [Deinococcus hopiensis]|uniref:Uncharacterized protein n=1 Tax=Deinococcus hopiensis KR-140 TaxID=695939 RepID=A0A1W1VRE3_9DEIO|nr:hypothetical protein [Deinococcus hopiensis]SMB95906.1 hypothetical protein SAMN00790413_03066 [Deinococcus hopiensis KR-140]